MTKRVTITKTKLKGGLVFGALILIFMAITSFFSSSQDAEKSSLVPDKDATINDQALGVEFYYPPPETHGGWRSNTDPRFIASLGIDNVAMDKFARWNMGLIPREDYKALLIIKDGWIIGEWYNETTSRDVNVYLASIGKSLSSILFGIMLDKIDKGEIDLPMSAQGPLDINSNVYDSRWLPQGFPLSDPRKAQITFEQILNHTSGMTPEEDNQKKVVEQGRNQWSDYVDWVVGHDPLWPVNSELFFDPGYPQQYLGHEQWSEHAGAYSSVAFAHLGLIIANVTGMPASDFLQKTLMDRIGVSDVDYHLPPTKKVRWFNAAGIKMKARDVARVAYLLMKDGRWGRVNKDASTIEKQIVSSKWVEKFMESNDYQNIRSNKDDYFGAQYPKDLTRMYGSGVNLVFMVPSQNLIVMRLGQASNDYFDEIQTGFLELLDDMMAFSKKDK